MEGFKQRDVEIRFISARDLSGFSGENGAERGERGSKRISGEAPAAIQVSDGGPGREERSSKIWDTC